ncbi:hypothetical protein [Proteiniclasticum sp. QWL-01]|uniref:SWIM zinc finger family protein n=1 Tax=Proteiniclasticum sp. QWL-01 TaxID=3036945 RepID=UPI0024100E1E|nr:hypothetical protein [Proteiniclasticum sp. QWL-01]WFF72083.1 hypothetical protein P6M73_12330 [Proteiniclasticum sp. QWL-01]
MSYGKRYVSADEKRIKAAKSLAKLEKKRSDLEPVVISGTAIAKTWWGKSWMKNLERYADYSNRIGRGKSYVRSNAVLDLKIRPMEATALVQGSRAKPYQVEIRIDGITDAQWQAITKFTQNKITSLDELLKGKFPLELENLLFDPRIGLFPAPSQIHFSCSCPDWASMCKHVAAVLYGIANRLDQDPILLFQLRGRDGNELIRNSMDLTIQHMLEHAGSTSNREISEEDIDKIFGLGSIINLRDESDLNKSRSKEQREKASRKAVRKVKTK